MSLPGPIFLRSAHGPHLALAPLLGLALLGAACRPGPPQPPPPTDSPRVQITLPLHEIAPEPGWSVESGPAKGVTTTVDIPDGAWRSGAALELPAFGGIARVTVGDAAPLDVQGGPGGAVVPLPELPAGPVRIDIRPLPVDEADPVVLGGDGRRSAGLHTDPVLVLRPARHVEHATVVDDGEKVRPRALVHDAPDGATVQFRVVADGRVLADLGSAPVAGGQAEGAAQDWPLDRWGPGEPALYVLVAELQDGEGRVLDRHAGRFGVRRVAPEGDGWRVGERTLKIAATRPRSKVTPDAVRSAVWTGANAVEFHGGPPVQSELDDLDEVGLMALSTPRCGGAPRRTLTTEQVRRGIAKNRDTLRQQDERLAWQLAGNPSAVLWVVEMPEFPVLAELWDETDPQGRPSVGGTVPLQTVTIPSPSRTTPPAGGFIVETAWNGPAGDPRELAALWTQVITGGARGGVMAHAHTDADAAVWRETLDALGVEPPAPKGRRSRSELTVEGAAPGQLVWLSGPWVPAVGTVAGADGRAHVEVWHEGPATLHIGATELPVTLEPSRWTAEGGREGGATVSAPR